MATNTKKSQTKSALPEISKKKRAQKRTRMSPERRSEDFVKEAIGYFSEVGFDGGTRELARRLGVTQPLLYRYFPTKEHLIRAVYENVYLNRWQSDWENILVDRNRPFYDRLMQFYNSYTDAIFSQEWMRIYMLSGLRGVEINEWYSKLVEQRLLKPICREYRHSLGNPNDSRRVSKRELELVWTLHGGIIYYGVRKYIYRLPPPEDKSAMIENAVKAFIAGGEEVFGKG